MARSRLPNPNGMALLLLGGAPELVWGRAGSDFFELKYEPGELP